MSANKFTTPPTRVFLKSLDDGTQIDAQYNPGQLEIGKDIPWTPVSQANNENANGLHLEFTGAQGRTTSLELLFDGFERRGATTNASSDTVVMAVKKLEKLASVWKPGSTKEDERRPHRCVATWGSTLAEFRCVITKLSTKYTMFGTDGTPLRATCTVTLKEAEVVSVKKGEGAGPASPPATPSANPTTPRGGS